jgi:5,6-dimethylbenzimidazole synthase
MSADGGTFDENFSNELMRLFTWRRDVRRFRRDSIDRALIDACLAAAELAPSVGNSQPWRWVEVQSPAARVAVRDSFALCNAEALNGYTGERAQLYAGLKLAGLDAAPVQLAVFCDRGTDQGDGLGRQTMPEMLDYSTVTAVHTLWLAARARGLGVGWVSILDPVAVQAALSVPESWRLVAYLCLGWPEEEHRDPELERHGWQARTSTATRTFVR